MDDKLTPGGIKKQKQKELKRIAKEKKVEFELRELEQKENQLAIKQQKLFEKKAIDAANEKGPYGTKGEPRKSLSTFFRNQNKLDVSLIAIIDRKAAILIRISSTIISAFVVFHDYIENNVNNGHLISIVLMVGLMITLVLAILATKPYVSRIRKIIEKEIKPIYPHLEQNLFASSQLNCSLKEYENAMEILVRSQNLHIGNQIRGSYMIGQTNAFKSKLVDWAFNVFLCSFLIVGLIYIISITL